MLVLATLELTAMDTNLLELVFQSLHVLQYHALKCERLKKWFVGPH